MKKLLITASISILLTTSINAKWGHGPHGGYNANLQNTSIIQELSQTQQEDLQFMYQEEKLARDVYITLSHIWDSRIFLNIQRSEQKHQSAIKNLLVQYNLPIPVESDEIGIFENEELQSLYNQLISKGEQSLKDALEVGVLIEKTDIEDLEAKMTNVPDNIKKVYSNLLRGSYRHLKAFNNNLRRVE